MNLPHGWQAKRASGLLGCCCLYSRKPALPAVCYLGESPKRRGFKSLRYGLGSDVDMCAARQHAEDRQPDSSPLDPRSHRANKANDREGAGAKILPLSPLVSRRAARRDERNHGRRSAVMKKMPAPLVQFSAETKSPRL